MALLKLWRLMVFAMLTLLSLVALVSSAFLNAKSSPKFRFAMFIFPFILSIVTLLVVPTIMIVEYTTRNNLNTRIGRLATVKFQLPILLLLQLAWFICAHIGMTEFFGPFRGCRHGKGVGVVSAGLDVPSYCKTIAVIHGAEWLSWIGFLDICTFSLVAILRQSRHLFELRMVDLMITGQSRVASDSPISTGLKEN